MAQTTTYRCGEACQRFLPFTIFHCFYMRRHMKNDALSELVDDFQSWCVLRRESSFQLRAFAAKCASTFRSTPKKLWLFQRPHVDASTPYGLKVQERY